jgi:hypothetical protein
MNFSSPDKVYTLIEAMRVADQPRAYNRALIDDLFNGLPPFTEAQEKDNLLQTNVNFLEGPNIAHSARRQLHNAFLKPGNFFNVDLDFGPPHLRINWGNQITRKINKPLKLSMPYLETLRATFAQIVLHGVGPVFWEDQNKWCPYARGVEDVLIPSGTLVSMENLDHLAVFRRYTAAELYRKTHGKYVDPGWNVKMAEKIVTNLAKDYAQTTNWNDWRFPEKLAEDIKENAGYYGSDAVPTVNCWDFYFLNDEGDEWHRKVIIDSQNPANTDSLQMLFGSKEFLYESRKSYAPSLDRFMHVQFADSSSVAPFRWHSVRSLGYLLFAVCNLQNRLRCRFSDSVNESLIWYFHNVAEEDREKLLKIQLHHMGIIPQGVSFVTANERFQPNEALVQMGMAQNRQLMSENSAAFVQEVNDGTNKELTATETMARVQTANAMVGAMLNLAYTYQTSQYREIARRFCEGDDPDAKKFRESCQKDGIPPEALDIEKWNIEPERVLGTGNKALEIAQADRLMAARNLYDPEAQRTILHIYTEANTDDPKLAETLVPMQPASAPSTSENQASLAMGTLMLGLPVAPPRDISFIEYTDVLLKLTGVLVTRYEENGGMVTKETLAGLINTANYIRALIQHIAGDQNEKQRVKVYMDALGQIESLIKAFAQRLEEQESQTQMDPETMAKLQAQQALTQSKIQTSTALTEQKIRQSEAKFQQRLEQNEAKLQTSLGDQAIRTRTDLQEQQLRTAADLQEQDIRTALEAKLAAKELKETKETKKE